MLDSLVELASASAWTYAIVFAFAALDAVAPIVPSETLVVSAAALAASGRLQLPIVLLAATVGALVGDNAAYFVGRAFSEPLRRKFSATPKRRKRLASAERQLRARGATIIVVSRFIPGGRTATMFAAGMLEMSWRRFLTLDLAAAIIWALYGGSIGFFGGAAFEDEPLVGVALALALAAVVGVAIEAGRRLRRRRRAATAQTPRCRSTEARPEPQAETAG
jgi:membrane protein DedA with SNARE-associated domain